MKSSKSVIAGLALTSFLVAAPAVAQVNGEGSMQVGNATVTVGGGTAILSLPEIEFVKIRAGGSGPVLSRLKSSDDFDEEVGWNINGSIAAPMGTNTTVSLSGFWAEIDDDDNVRCTSQGGGGTPKCTVNSIADNPTRPDNVAFPFPGTSLVTTKRDVDHWGASLEAKWALEPRVKTQSGY